MVVNPAMKLAEKSRLTGVATLILTTSAIAVFRLSVFAAEITWKGGGDTAAWSDGTNWEGDTAPAKGDVAVLPEGATVGATMADVTWMHAADTKLGGIRFAGDDTVLMFTNITASKTITVPFTGKGEFRLLNNTSGITIGMQADNSEYLGSFVISNSPVHYQRPYCMGTTNKVSYWGNSSWVKYFSFNQQGNVTTNEFHLYGEKSYFYAGGVSREFYGPVYIHGNNWLSQAGNTTQSYYGGVYYVGTATGNTGPGFGGRTHFYNTPVDFGKLWIRGVESDDSGSGGVWLIGTDVNAAMISPPNNANQGAGVLRFVRKNCLTPTTGIYLRPAAGVDLNGYDQRCGDFTISSEGGLNPKYAYIKSANAATLTVLGNGPSRFNGLINGKVSLELNSTNSATAGAFGLCGTNNTTTGALIARRGTITVLPGAAFSNLTALVASDEGVIDVQSAATLASLSTVTVSGNGTVRLGSPCLNENLTALDIADGASVVLEGGEYRFYSVRIGGKYLAARSYAAGDEALKGVITGTGSVSVFAKPVAEVEEFVWSGAQGSDMSSGGNWDGGAAPDWAEGNADALFGDLGSALAEMTSAGALNGVSIRRSAGFTLGGTSPVSLGAGGLKAANTSASGVVTNTISTMLNMAVLPQRQWSVGERTVLDIRAPVTSVDLEGVEATGIGGAGTILLRAASPDLTAPLTFTNAMTHVLAYQALGSSNRTVTVKASGIIFAGNGLTNDVPLRFIDGSSDLYLTGENYWNQGWVQRGRITAVGKSITLNCGHGYRIQGGLTSENGGSFYFLLPWNRHLYFENKPFDMPNGSITLDNNGIYHFVSTNNSLGRINSNLPNVRCDSDYALPANATFQFGATWKDDYNGGIDMNGHDQKLSAITCGWDPSAMATRTGEVWGVTGTLEVCGKTGSNVAICFKGGTSYRHSGVSTNVFWNTANTSTGRLEVVNGKVKLRSGAGWPRASGVIISGGGVLEISPDTTDVAFGPEQGKSSAALEFVDGTGTLEIPSGTVTVKTLCVGSRWRAAGIYDSSALPGRISGSGYLRVLRSGGPGAFVIVR